MCQAMEFPSSPAPTEAEAEAAAASVPFPADPSDEKKQRQQQQQQPWRQQRCCCCLWNKFCAEKGTKFSLAAAFLALMAVLVGVGVGVGGAKRGGECEWAEELQLQAQRMRMVATALFSDQRLLFVLINLLIAVLILNSNSASYSSLDLYEEFVRQNTATRSRICSPRTPRFRRSHTDVAEHRRQQQQQHRQRRRLVRSATTVSGPDGDRILHNLADSMAASNHGDAAAAAASGFHGQEPQSESRPQPQPKLESESEREQQKQEQQRRRDDCDGIVVSVDENCEEDKQSESDEELKQRVEAFIAKVQGNILRERQESFARRFVTFAY